MMIMRAFARQVGAVAVLSAAVLLVNCAGRASSGGDGGDSGALTLDNAIKRAAARIDERVEAGTKIALLNFKSPSDRFSEYFISELEANLLDNGKLTVIDRKEIDLIRNEMIFQTSGEVSDESIQKIGQKLGAQSIVSGSLMEIGKTYRVVVRVLNVETAAVAAQYRNDIRNDDRVQALLAERKPNFALLSPPNTPRATEIPVRGLGAATVTNTPTTTPAPTDVASTGGGGVITTAPVADASATESTAAPANDQVKVYKLGDTGPAGGLIFYDKGNNQDGWRYMEAAPANTERKMTWWVKRYLNELLKKESSNGQINTKELMDYVNENCGIYNNEIPPIRYCSTLEVNGYKDWYLPSGWELGLMCRNLHIRGMGKFDSEGMYWSSNVRKDVHRSAWDGSIWGDAYYVNFVNGSGNYGETNKVLFVRAARRF